MNGWFPQISPDGQHVASGFGDWWLDGQRMPGTGHYPKWLDADLLAVYDGNHTLRCWSVRDGELPPISTEAHCNKVAAGGGFCVWEQSGSGLYFADGVFLADGFSPARWGERQLAYLLDGDQPTQRLVVNGREVARASFTSLCCNQSALVLVADNATLYGMRWGEPGLTRIQPSWQGCNYGVPVEGPDGLYLLARDDARLMLAKWGAPQGYVVANGETGDAHAIWTGTDWRVVWWNKVTCVLHDVCLAPGTLVDLSADPRPPAPQPAIAFAFDDDAPVHAPARKRAHLVDPANLRPGAVRWRAGLKGLETLPLSYPNDDLAHEFSFAAPGDYEVMVTGQGLLETPDELPDSGGKVVESPRQLLTVLEPLPTPPPDPPPAVRGFRGICAGATTPLGMEFLTDAKAHGYEVIRPDCQRSTEAQLAAIVAELRAVGVRPFLLCLASQFGIMPEAVDVEPRHALDTSKEGAEPNLVIDAEAYARVINAAMPAARTRWLVVWAGMPNINPGDREWIRQLCATLDPDIGISLHPYCLTGREPWRDPTPELRAVLPLFGARPWVIGECGEHQGPVTNPPVSALQKFLAKFGLHLNGHHHLSDADQALFNERTIQVCRKLGCEVFCLYQVTDGQSRCKEHPTMPNTRLDAYGRKRRDGTWKPYVMMG